LAATIPIEPGPYTLRELLRMHRSAAQSRWDHTAHLLCQQYDMNRDPTKNKKLNPIDFHPYRFEKIGSRSKGAQQASQPSNGMPVAQLHAFKSILPVIYAE
jgi:hypothetical protein